MIQDDEEDELEDEDDDTQGRPKASSLFYFTFTGLSLITMQATVRPGKRQKLVGFACHSTGDIQR